jgi:hypothetical protein
VRLLPVFSGGTGFIEPRIGSVRSGDVIELQKVFAIDVLAFTG